METKVCCTCHEEKDIESFDFRYKIKGIRQRICKSCKKIARKNSYHNHKDHVIAKNLANKGKNVQWYEAYKKTLKCERCPENDPVCLDFHHINPQEKDFAVSIIVRGTYSKERIMKEINKCIVLCANCHRKEHSKRMPH